MLFNPSKNKNACVYGPPEMFMAKPEPQDEITEENREPYDEDDRVVIVGMGAMGLLYAERLNSVIPCDVTFLMDEQRYLKNKDKVFLINGTEHRFNMTTPDMYPKERPADIVIVATKATALDEAMELMTCCVGDSTVIVSLLNGITSEEILATRFNERNIIPCVAQGMDAVKFGDELTYTSDGTLFLGSGDRTKTLPFLMLFCIFKEHGVNCTAENDIMLRMWKKFMLNCGINQSCMVHGATYGTAVIPDTEPYNTFVGSMREVQKLAALEGYDITDEDIDYYIGLMGSLNPEGMPSMAQDRINRKHSEVELFAGTVIKLAKKHGIEVPINEWIYERVSEIESEY